jgi:xanthine dehydrogenase YagR molybdenum-binding subunit
MSTHYIGKAQSRVDGVAKVTGAAKYAAEYNVPGLTYGVVVSSAIARGKIKEIDAREALQLEGVLQVFTHENRPSLAWFNRSYKDEDAPPGDHFRPLYDDEIQFNMQPIALVVAETFEVARYASTLVHVKYEQESHTTALEENRDQAYEPKKGKSDWKKPKSRGDAPKALAESPVKVDVEYEHTAEHHNPMEMHATTVVWEADGRMTVYDKTQGAPNSQQYITKVFGLSKDEARVVSPYVGGAFGSGLRPQYQLFMAVMAAKELKRSVRVSLTRQQMFSFGHRPATIQHLAFGASPDGTLQAIEHTSFQETSQFENYTETVVNWSGVLYQCNNVKMSHQLVKLDVYTPLDMRAPGGVTGVYATECAMDELAYVAHVDPLELRLKNYAEMDQVEGKPFSSKELRECYRQGAEKFGWAKRNLSPRSMRDGNTLIGWGMATGAWLAEQQKASAKAVLSSDGHLTVSSATADIGTGTYTIMTQIAADILGLPLEQVTFQLGDSDLPEAPLEGGSWTAASVGSAVKVVCEELCVKLLTLAQRSDHAAFRSARINEVDFTDGQLRLRNDPFQSIDLTKLVRQNGEEKLEVEASSQPNMANHMIYSRYTHSAVFVEVRVDEDLGTVHVSRVVSAVAAGRILNPKTARSQVIGGVVWGIGMALEEESVLDHQFGKFINHDLAEYHVPVNLDVKEIDVIFVEEHDEVVNPLGVKGLGEIGIVGVAAAISNAVFHATGKRIRELPITLDKVMEAKIETH